MIDWIAGLGLSARITASLSVALIAWYVYRAIGIGRMIAGIASSAAIIAIAVVLWTALGVGAGWIDLADLSTTLGSWVRIGSRIIVETIRSILDKVVS